MASFNAEKEKISIKIRSKGGCFCREHHACNAYKIIDQQLKSIPVEDLSFVEHETGPELLIWVALGTSGITLAASIIELIKAIMVARSEGTKHGDEHYDYLELSVRKFYKNGKIREETVAKFYPRDPLDKELIEQPLRTKIIKLLSKPKKKK
jgi:hypothetical protein